MTIQEYRYSVSDVIFKDAGNAEVPDKFKELFNEYCEEVNILPVSTPMWRLPVMPEYKNCILERSRYKAYTKSLLCSSDEKKMQAAEGAMLNQLGRYYESAQLEDYHKKARAELEAWRKRKRA